MYGKTDGTTFEGTSAAGNFQEALTDAVNKALESAGGADRLVFWTLGEVKGENGGIVGKNEITVTIQATFDSQGKK